MTAPDSDAEYIKRLKEQLNAAHKENARLQSKCEEMRRLLEKVQRYVDVYRDDVHIEINDALSSTPPTNLISKDQLKPIVEALEACVASASPNRREHPTMYSTWRLAEKALQLARELGLS